MKILKIIILLFQCVWIHAQTFEISGKVVDGIDNQYLAGAIIRVKNSGQIIVSSAHGEFAIKNLNPGNYTFNISMYGYETKDIRVSLSNSDTSISVSMIPVINDMEAIVITGTKSEKKLKETPVLTQVISPEKLKEAGITNVGAALEYEISGLDFNVAQNPLRPSITFQGMNASYILLLLNGERIAGEKNGNLDFYRLNLDNVERIEIVRGASSVLYGSNAIGGVVNIITKRPVLPFEMNAMGRYSNYNELESGIILSMKRKNVATLSNIVYNQSDGYDLTTKAVLNSPWHTQEKYKNGSIGQQFEFYPVKNLTVITNGGLYYNRLFVSRVKQADSAYAGINGFAKAIYKINDSSDFVFSYSTDHYSTYSILINNNNKHIRSSYDYIQSVKLTSNLKFYKSTLTTGLDYTPEQLYSGYLTSGIKKATESAGYLQFDYKFNKIYSAIGGIRVTNHSSYGLNAVPKISFMARAGTAILRLSYGFGYRSPTLKELYYYFEHFGMFTLLGNPGLKPERSQYLGISLEINKKQVSHTFNIYYNRITNLISNRWIDSLTAKYVNDSSAAIFGVDIMEKISPFRNFLISTGISIVNARNMVTRQQLYNISPVSANFNVSYSFKTFHENTLIELYGKYNGSRKYEPVNGIEYSDRPYNIWKLSFTQHYKNILTFTFGIDNIFNVIDPKSFDNLSPGRRYFIALNLKLTSY